MKVVEAHNIHVDVQDRLLLSIDQLTIKEKDRIGLVGRNGSGKTTLLHVLAGKVEPDKGTVIRNGTIQLLPQLKRIDSVKSGGEITQRYVKEALIKSPKLLLADEPTTHLDTDHIEWLEKKLMEWQGAFVVVSHDRAFLDAVCTVIWEIDEGQIRVYKGNYSAYAAQKETERQRHDLEYEKYEQTKKQLEQAIAAKQKKAERAVKKPNSVGSAEARKAKPYFAKKQKKLQTTAKVLETRVEKLEKVEKPKELPPIRMNVQEQESLKNRVIIRAKQVEGKTGSRILWEPAAFFIRGGEKAALIGPNGSGKTTLLKKIVHSDTGISVAPAVRIGYFSQHITILDADRSILENVKETSSQDETLIRTVLARLGFWREDVFKEVNVLSGGERVKTALAKLLVSDMNVLILDEPTNFLDLEAVEALEFLFMEYEGTVLFTSHDRRFAGKIATKVLAIHETKLHIFDGTMKEYEESQQKTGPDETEEKLLLIETKIAEVLGKISIEPSEELEKEFQQLLVEKRMLTKG